MVARSDSSFGRVASRPRRSVRQHSIRLPPNASNPRRPWGATRRLPATHSHRLRRYESHLTSRPIPRQLTTFPRVISDRLAVATLLRPLPPRGRSPPRYRCSPARPSTYRPPSPPFARRSPPLPGIAQRSWHLPRGRAHRGVRPRRCRHRPRRDAPELGARAELRLRGPTQHGPFRRASSLHDQPPPALSSNPRDSSRSSAGVPHRRRPRSLFRVGASFSKKNAPLPRKSLLFGERGCSSAKEAALRRKRLFFPAKEAPLPVRRLRSSV